MFDFLYTDIPFLIKAYRVLILVSLWLGFCLILYLLNKLRVFLTPKSFSKIAKKFLENNGSRLEPFFGVVIALLFLGVFLFSIVQGIFWLIQNWPKQ